MLKMLCIGNLIPCFYNYANILTFIYLACFEIFITFRGQTFYRVDFPSGLDAGKEVTVDVETSYSHSMHPYPTHITQSERQYVRFVGNVYFYSPYQTQTVTTVVSCATSNIESYTKEKPVSSTEKTITYGPYDNVEPFKEVICSWCMMEFIAVVWATTKTTCRAISTCDVLPCQQLRSIMQHDSMMHVINVHSITE